MTKASLVIEADPTRHDRRDEIALRAAALFREKGYAGTSMADVAKAVSIQKPSLYHHFASKEALFVAAMTTDLAEIPGRLAALRHDASLSHEDRLRRGIEIVYSGIVESSAGQMAPVVAETARKIPEVAQGFYDSFIDQLSDAMIDIVRDGQDAGVFGPLDPVTCYHLIFGPPVNIAISRSMFGGIDRAQHRLDASVACKGQQDALLKILRPA
ncbi:MAG: TetR/AcrR family transcriptional regulator [Pseudomonadota bacterium]